MGPDHRFASIPYSYLSSLPFLTHGLVLVRASALAHAYNASQTFWRLLSEPLTQESVYASASRLAQIGLLPPPLQHLCHYPFCYYSQTVALAAFAQAAQVLGKDSRFLRCNAFAFTDRVAFLKGGHHIVRDHNVHCASAEPCDRGLLICSSSQPTLLLKASKQIQM